MTTTPARVADAAPAPTATGEAPTVDIQSTTRQQVLSKDIIDMLPTGRNYASLGQLLPAIADALEPSAALLLRVLPPPLAQDCCAQPRRAAKSR